MNSLVLTAANTLMPRRVLPTKSPRATHPGPSPAQGTRVATHVSTPSPAAMRTPTKPKHARHTRLSPQLTLNVPLDPQPATLAPDEASPATVSDTLATLAQQRRKCGVPAPWEHAASMRCDEDVAADLVETSSRLQRQGFSDSQTEVIQERLYGLLSVVPDLAPRMVDCRNSQLEAFLEDPVAVAIGMVRLKTLFPKQNIGALVVELPELLDSQMLAQLPQEIPKIQALLGISDINIVFNTRPLLLNSAAVAEALEDMAAAAPEGDDVVQQLLAYPAYVNQSTRLGLMAAYEAKARIRENERLDAEAARIQSEERVKELRFQRQQDELLRST